MTPLPIAPSGIFLDTGKNPAACKVSLFLLVAGLIELVEEDDSCETVAVLLGTKGEASGDNDDTGCQQLRKCN
jgi:hypothetical protein